MLPDHFEMRNCMYVVLKTYDLLKISVYLYNMHNNNFYINLERIILQIVHWL